MKQLAIFILCVLCLSGTSHADQVLGIRESTVKQLQKIQLAMDAGEFSQAKQLINKLKSAKLRDYERAQVLNIEGYIFFEENNTQAALDNFEQVIAIKGIPSGLRQTVLKSLAQLYLMDEKYEKALGIVEDMLNNERKKEASTYVMRSQTLYHLNRYQAALTDIDRALSMDEALEIPPRENWLLIKNAILFELERYTDMVKVVETLLKHYPKDRYLTSLATLYSQQDMSQAQLALLESLYEDGRLKKQEHLINLAHLYLSLQTPYKSAQLLTEGMANGTVEKNFRHLNLRAKSYQLAEHRERAINAYREAAELAENGDIYVNIAHLHISALEWKAADAALKQAFAKGELREPGGAHLLQGMVRFYQKDYNQAKQSFLSAASFPEMEQHAEQWLNYLGSELDKLATLEEQRSSRQRNLAASESEITSPEG